MCHPEYSSLREEEEIKRGNIDSIFKIENTSDVYDIDLSDCEKLSILGGEPSIDLEVRKWINHTIKDFNMPFSSMVIFMVKWAIASIPAIIIIWILVMILISVFGSSLAVLRII